MTSVQTPIKKHPQFILGAANSFFEDHLLQRCNAATKTFCHSMTSFPASVWINEVQSHLTIRERESLDEIVHHNQQNIPKVWSAESAVFKGDREVRQLLPYLIVRQKQADGQYLYFPYRRTKKIGETRLAGNGSIGYGGHIDLADIVQTNSVIDLHSTIVLSALREADEEFEMTDAFGTRLAIDDAAMFTFEDLFILDNTNDVGRLHVGIVMALEVPFGYNIKTMEDELATLPPMTADQMLTDPDFNAENWTRLYLEYVVSTHVPKCVEDAIAADLDATMNVIENGLRVAHVNEKHATGELATEIGCLFSNVEISRDSLYRDYANVWAAAPEEVLAGTVSAENAHAYGFKVIPASETTININVESNVRQIGKTSLAVLIQKALVKAGYTNVELNSPDVEAAERSGGKFSMYAENAGPATDLKIVVRDVYLHDRALKK